LPESFHYLSHFETHPYADDEFRSISKMFLAIAKQHFALSSCRRRDEALGQMASGDGDNKLERFRGEKAKQ
jgi:hypothetical protein